MATPPRRLENNIMLRHLHHGLAALILVFSLSLPFALGQANSPSPTIERGVKGEPAADEQSGSSAAALP
ncbi:MAG: hypothetical protein ACRELF_11250, partial [Gemmataceae bacterium]